MAALMKGEMKFIHAGEKGGAGFRTGGHAILRGAEESRPVSKS